MRVSCLLHILLCVFLFSITIHAYEVDTQDNLTKEHIYRQISKPNNDTNITIQYCRWAQLPNPYCPGNIEEVLYEIDAPWRIQSSETYIPILAIVESRAKNVTYIEFWDAFDNVLIYNHTSPIIIPLYSEIDFPIVVPISVNKNSLGNIGGRVSVKAKLHLYRNSYW